MSASNPFRGPEELYLNGIREDLAALRQRRVHYVAVMAALAGEELTSVKYDGRSLDIYFTSDRATFTRVFGAIRRPLERGDAEAWGEGGKGMSATKWLPLYRKLYAHNQDALKEALYCHAQIRAAFPPELTDGPDQIITPVLQLACELLNIKPEDAE